MRGSKPSLLLGILLSSCATKNYVEYRSPSTVPMELTETIDGSLVHWVRVKVDGADTVLDFNGHVVVFRGRTGHSGRVTLDRADLTIADLNVQIDPSRITIRGRDFGIEKSQVDRSRRWIVEGQSIMLE